MTASGNVVLAGDEATGGFGVWGESVDIRSSCYFSWGVQMSQTPNPSNGWKVKNKLLPKSAET
ncbi:hypothetical protein [Filomicrobium sp.]|jgi:hypothetical protein|uniref:hypothetical protein n=1 Tax=Filomicrobium sp. TaxID=2024831 RepID=UPI0002E6FE7D|nr:hypothetical protein [Filomicrobium sp.]|tara:strand:- start:460 stop:648 length:189 start_codon:yes stop_codon:yes gene_type:complete